MDILNIYPETLKENKEAIYALCMTDSLSVKDCVGQTLEVKAFCLYTETNADGGESEVLSIATDCGVIGTISPTFKREFAKIVDLMDGNFKIDILSGQSKGGRTFVSCKLHTEFSW